MASAIVAVICEDYGPSEFLKRLGDPLWFQSLGCVLGFDWHSSGLTTVVCGVLRDSLELSRHGVAALGGKGLASRAIPEKIGLAGLDEEEARQVIYASKISSKVDNNALQDGYKIYHHTVFFTEKAEWAVVQQGLNQDCGYARRYHWVGESVRSYVLEPHSGISGDRYEAAVLNMVSRQSLDAQKASLDVVAEGPARIQRLLSTVIQRQTTLENFETVHPRMHTALHVKLPRRINWDVVRRLYDVRPASYEELLLFQGVGAATVRALALISCLIYGVELDWRDPIKYSFAVGGKDGVPYPVSRRRMDEVIEFLEGVLERTAVESSTRREALRRLYGLAGQF